MSPSPSSSRYLRSWYSSTQYTRRNEINQSRRDTSTDSSNKNCRTDTHMHGPSVSPILLNVYVFLFFFSRPILMIKRVEIACAGRYSLAVNRVRRLETSKMRTQCTGGGGTACTFYTDRVDIIRRQVRANRRGGVPIAAAVRRALSKNRSQCTPPLPVIYV